MVKNTYISKSEVITLKKNKKGFTLIEVIIAMSVFAIMALLVCTLYGLLSKMVYMSYTMNSEVDSQSAIYEKSENGAHDTSDTKTIRFTYGANVADVTVDYITIDGGDSSSNPDIQYFRKP